MITYKASDLVKAALDLADLGNTDFPTASENRMYINNAWLKIYQQAIDLGATYWLKSIDVYGTDDLPEDFYQVDFIEDERHNQIDRYQRGMSESNRYYRILNDKIVLNKVEHVILWYNPAPTELDTSETGDVDLNYPNNIFYNLMIYELAKYYKIKQNADYSGIQALYNEAWDLFYDMLTRDNNQNIVIKDVYSYNNILGV